MKKSILLLFIGLFTMTINSCSDESSDDPKPTEIKGLSVKINGTSRTFSQINVQQESWDDNGVPKVDLIITAANSSDPEEVLYLSIGKGDVGEGQIFWLSYNKNNVIYSRSTEDIKSNISLNSGNRLKGDFNSILLAEDQSSSQALTEGSFDITY